MTGTKEKHYSVEVTATVGGYISLNAESEESAVDQVKKLVEEIGLEALSKQIQGTAGTRPISELTKLTGEEITHREQFVFFDKLIDDKPFLKNGERDAHFIETMQSAGYGICEECDGVVDGNAEGWHDHTVHGEGNVCGDCSNSPPHCEDYCDMEDEDAK